MATYRCKVCDGLYVSPQGGYQYLHTCGPLTDPVTGEQHRRPGHRDENYVQKMPDQDAPPIPPGESRRLGTVTRHAWGAGRVKLSDDDLVTGASLPRLAELRLLAGMEEGAPPD